MSDERQFEPAHDLIHVKIIDESPVNDSGLYTSLGPEPVIVGEVIATGPKARSVSIGNRIIFERVNLITVRYSRQITHLVRDGVVLGTI